MLSSTQDYLKWIDEKKKIGMSWLVNSIETSRRIDDKVPEMVLARDIAARNSLGCGLVRSSGEKIDISMTVSEAKKQFMEMLEKSRNEKGRKHINLGNVEIKGIITDISGFMIIDRCRQCGKETKSRRRCKCGGESTARLCLFAEITDHTGTIQVVCEDRIAEIILAAHPAQIAGRINNIQRGFVFLFKYIKSNNMSSGMVSQLRNVVNPEYGHALIGMPVHAAGNLFLNNNRKINMKIFWFETPTYEEDIALLSKQNEIKNCAKDSAILQRIECLKKL